MPFSDDLAILAEDVTTELAHLAVTVATTTAPGSLDATTAARSSPIVVSDTVSAAVAGPTGSRTETGADRRAARDLVVTVLAADLTNHAAASAEPGPARTAVTAGGRAMRVVQLERIGGGRVYMMTLRGDG